MSLLCNQCECLNINGIRCHEAGCPNEGEQIYLIDDGTLDTVFECKSCREEFRFNFANSCDDPDEEYDYDDFLYDCLHELQDEHVCEVESEYEFA